MRFYRLHVLVFILDRQSSRMVWTAQDVCEQYTNQNVAAWGAGASEVCPNLEENQSESVRLTKPTDVTASLLGSRTNFIVASVVTSLVLPCFEGSTHVPEMAFANDRSETCLRVVEVRALVARGQAT